MLLADGFNELPTDQARAEFRKFCGRNIPVIVTSRELANDLGLERKLDLPPPSSQQVARFLEERLPNCDRAQLQKLGDRVRDLGQTPLMIWMLYSIFQTRHEIPETRGEAYRAFTTLYAEKAKEGIDLTESRTVLSKLAFEMMQSPKPDDPTDFRLDISEVEAQTALGSEKTLKHLVDFHLLHWQGKPGNRKVRFCHQSLQEYYAAEYLLPQLPNLSNEALQRHYLNYLKWTEPIALMLALVEDEAQVVRVVELAIGVDLAIRVDLMLGARLAGKVNRDFQKHTVDQIVNLEMDLKLKIMLLGEAHSEKSITSLSTALENPDVYVRQKAAEALGQIGGEQAVKLLIETLKDFDYSDELGCSVSYMAAKALGQIGSEKAIVPLSEMLEDQTNSERWSVAIALGQIGGDKVIDALSKALDNDDDPDMNIHTSIVTALEQVGGEQAIAPLSKALKHKNINLLACTFAVAALEKIGGEKAIAALIEALDHPDDHIREFATSTLEQLRSDQKTVVYENREIEDSDSYTHLAKRVAKFDNETVLSFPLVKSLENPDSDTRWSAARSLGKLGHPAPLSLLWKMQIEGTVNCLEAIANIQSRCKFYNYEIFQAAQEPENPQTENPEKTAIVYQIDSVGNLNTGTVNVKGDQIGTQQNSDNGA